MEQDAAERVDVGAGVDPLAADLLGGDVAERADPAARARRAARARMRLVSPKSVRYAWSPAEQDVGRLDVAVDEPARVRGVERGRDLRDDVRGAPGLEPTAARGRACAGRCRRRSAWPDRGALELARVVDRDHVGVVDRGGEPRLAHEAVAEGRVLGEVGGDQLERDGPIEVELVGPVDHAHAAAAGDAGDAVTGEYVAWVEVGKFPLY